MRLKASISSPISLWYGHREREVAAAFRRVHQRAGAAVQHLQRPGDGAGHQQQPAGPRPPSTPRRKWPCRPEKWPSAPVPGAIGLHPGKAAQVAAGVDGPHAFQRLAPRLKTLGSSRRTSGICANSPDPARYLPRHVPPPAPLHRRSQTARCPPGPSPWQATLGASPIIFTTGHPAGTLLFEGLGGLQRNRSGLVRQPLLGVNPDFVRLLADQDHRERPIDSASSSTRPASICHRIDRGHQRIDTPVLPAFKCAPVYPSDPLRKLLLSLDASAAAICRRGNGHSQ